MPASRGWLGGWLPSGWSADGSPFSTSLTRSDLASAGQVIFRLSDGQDAAMASATSSPLDKDRC